MDSRTRLDYALFQLTPTRTRCDLVIFSGVISEKLASGLFQPFVSHLRFAKDEISKGGYSIRLCPPVSDALWFTKATFQRFVCFVRSPEVLERFIALEREICHIELSIQVNESSVTDVAEDFREGCVSVGNGAIKEPTDFSMRKSESRRTGDSVEEENSKIHLLRILETRRALLRKEQAMAYARAFVSGFEMASIADLTYFADVFGASRLREACVNFNEICVKKQTDGLWMDELAAVQECSPSELALPETSGILLANGTSEPNKNIKSSFLKDSVPSGNDGNNNYKLPQSAQVASTGVKDRVTVSWPNQIPQHMYNFPGPIQQMHPYAGYPLPAMSPVPLYFRNMQQSVQEPDGYEKHKTSTKGPKAYDRKGSEFSSEDSQAESNDTDPVSDPESNAELDKNCSSRERSMRKKHKKKSSRTVVIRNINYITSKKRDSEKDELSDTASSEDDISSIGDTIREKLSILKGRHKQKNKRQSQSSSNESDDNVDADLDALKGEKNCDSWDALQNFLLRSVETSDDAKQNQQSNIQDEHYTTRSSEEESLFRASHAMDLGSEEVARTQMVPDDSFMVREKDEAGVESAMLVDFANGERMHPKVNMDCIDGELIYPSRSGDISTGKQTSPTDYDAEISLTKSRKADDCFIVNLSGKLENQAVPPDQTPFDRDHILSLESHSPFSRKSQKDQLIDDSFMVKDQTIDHQYDDQWKTDIRIVEDLSPSVKTENGNADKSQKRQENSSFNVPDDLCMVLERDSGFDLNKISWTMEYGLDISFAETDKRCSNDTTNNIEDEKLPSSNKILTKYKKEKPSGKNPGKEAISKVSRGPLGRSKSEIMSKSRKPSILNKAAIQKSKLEKEEEIRKKMEELLIQRQKRIAERTAANCSTPVISKKIPTERKTAKASIKSMNKTQPMVHGTNRLSSHKQALRV